MRVCLRMRTPSVISSVYWEAAKGGNPGLCVCLQVSGDEAGCPSDAGQPSERVASEPERLMLDVSLQRTPTSEADCLAQLGGGATVVLVQPAAVALVAAQAVATPQDGDLRLAGEGQARSSSVGSFVSKSGDVTGDVTGWTASGGAMTWNAMKASCTAKGPGLCTYEQLCPAALPPLGPFDDNAPADACRSSKPTAPRLGADRSSCRRHVRFT